MSNDNTQPTVQDLVELNTIQERTRNAEIHILNLRIKMLERRLLQAIAFARSTAENRVTVSDVVRQAITDLIMQSHVSVPIPQPSGAVADQPRA